MIKPFKKGYYLLTSYGSRIIIFVKPKLKKMYKINIIESNSELSDDMFADKFSLSAGALRDLFEFYETKYLGEFI